MKHKIRITTPPNFYHSHHISTNKANGIFRFAMMGERNDFEARAN
jgi:hypothetical protein